MQSSGFLKVGPGVPHRMQPNDRTHNWFAGLERGLTCFMLLRYGPRKVANPKEMGLGCVLVDRTVDTALQIPQNHSIDWKQRTVTMLPREEEQTDQLSEGSVGGSEGQVSCPGHGQTTNASQDNGGLSRCQCGQRTED